MNKKLAVLSLIMASSIYGESSSDTSVDLGKTLIYSTTGFATDVRKISSTPTVVTAKEIEEKNYKTVEEVLRNIPSVNVISQGNGYIIDLRGQGEKAKQNVQVLVDGVQMNSLDTSHTPTPINTLSPNDIERIEVIPGGGSVIYGNGTAGGVINIITKNKNKAKVTAGVEYGSYSNRKTNVAVSENIGKVDFNLSYTKHERDGYREKDTSDADMLMGNLRYNLSDRQYLSLKYTKYSDTVTYPEYLSEQKIKENRRQSGMTKEPTKVKTNKDEYVFTHYLKATDNLELTTNIFSQKTEMRVPDLFRDKKSGVKTKVKYNYGEKSNVIAGLEYIDNNVVRNSSGMSVATNDLNKKTLSTFIMNNYGVDNFIFSQGVRYENARYNIDRFSKGIVFPMGGRPVQLTSDASIKEKRNIDNFAYELSMSYLYSDTGKGYLRYERGFTSPPPALLTNKYNEGRIGAVNSYYKLNDLKSETYDNFEMGISDYLGFTTVNASVFYTVTKNEITTDMAGGMPPKQIINYNIGKTRRVGGELQFEQNIDKLRLREAYSYIDAKILKDKDKEIEGKKIANVPEHKLTLSADYNFTSNFNIGTDLVYTGSVYTDNTNKSGKVNSHLVTNIRANYSFANGLTLYAGINNLFNKDYYNDVDYNSKTKTYSYDPAAKINYYGGFRYTF